MRAAEHPKKVMITCYDATWARLISDLEVFDYLLVGDSLGMVLYGHSSTVPVQLDDMVRHADAVVRGVQQSKALKKPEVIVDLPAGTYDEPRQAVESAKRVLETGADMVKVEGALMQSISAMRKEKMRICGHLGLLPQSALQYRVQGRSEDEAKRIFSEARMLEEVGVELLVLEMIPSKLASTISEALRIPTVGIGAGSGTSGQVLVLYDLLGLNPDFRPRFLRTYLDGHALASEALRSYATDVRSGDFPSERESF